MTGMRRSGVLVPPIGFPAYQQLSSSIPVAAVSAEDADLAVEAAIHAELRRRRAEGAIDQSLDASTPRVEIF